MSVTVLRAGTLTTLQDRGRHGWAALGIGASGAMDDVALRLANALVGNPGDAVALELTWSGPRLRFEHDALVAFAGADCDAHVGDHALPGWRPLRIDAGAELDCGRMRNGARTCLAIAGGIRTAAVLGSAATDINAGIGAFAGRPLRRGDVLETGATKAQPIPRTRAWSLDPRPWFDARADAPIRLLRGSHADLLSAASRAELHRTPFRIHADSNRVGLRLDGPKLELTGSCEPISEPVTRGTMQLPAAGRPIVLMAEHPTTGGYPRIGQVAAIDLARLAQRSPGDEVRFRAIDIDEAQSRYLGRERALTRLVESIALRLADD
jgi:antagonist of KipI